MFKSFYARKARNQNAMISPISIVSLGFSFGSGAGWLGQLPSRQDLATPEQISLIFSGPQFFVTLISGLLLTFGFQLLLTNLSVAAGISYLGRSSHSEDASSEADSDGLSVRKISAGLGLWTLVSVTLALFFACYLAIQLSLLTDIALGAIIGLVIWAAYFTLLVWFSSSSVASLIGSVVHTATSGFQTVMGAATAAIGGQTAKQQIVSTAEAVMASVRNELGTALDPVQVRESVEEYLRRLEIPQLNTAKLRDDLRSLLNDPELAALAQNGGLRHINRQTFVDLIRQRSNFSRTEVERIADLLEGVWNQVVNSRPESKPSSIDALIDYLRSTEPGKLQMSDLNAKLDRLLTERSQAQRQSEAESPPGMMQQTLQLGMNTLIGLLMGRTDLSDMDLEKIFHQLKQAPTKLAASTGQITAQLKGEAPAEPAYSPIRHDVEQYLLQTYSWQMNPTVFDREFREILFDPNADPGAIVDQLLQLNRAFFVEVLASRGVLTQAKIQAVADQAEAIRVDVLAGAMVAKELELAADLQHRIETYLARVPKEQLEIEDIPAFRSLLQDDEAEYETLQSRLAAYHRAMLQQILMQRSDVMPEEYDRILNHLEANRDRVLFDAQSLNEKAKQTFADYQQRLSDYLRHTGKAELNPEGIRRDVQLLFEDPQQGFKSLRYRASQFDRDTYAQLLQQRGDLSTAEVNQILDQIESSWNALVHSPQRIVRAAQDGYDQTMEAIANYLRQTNLEELNPEGIQRDLTTLLEDPKQGAAALRHRLAKIDRETLVRLLSQRQDLSEAQVNRAIDQLQEGIRRVIRAPRRFALRTQQKLMDFETTFEDYLRHTDKQELNPEGIRRDLDLLVQSPKQGLQNLGDRLSQFDRTTLVALLAQRDDMTREEAEHIVSQIESVRNQVMQEMRQVQSRIQAVIDRFFDQIRQYLDALDRPELSYDGIKRDVRTLFDDPQAGFEALQHRLSQFDRGTLVAILSSRKDISETEANRIIDQVELARTSVLHQAERIQLETQRRLDAVKRQAQRQLEEARKAAAIAAWWLFSTALISAAAAAGAGALAAQ
jgi:nucleoid DNA-binding protein